MAQSKSGQPTGNLSFGSAAVILLVFLLIGGVGFWARGMAVAVPGPGIIKATPSGDVLVQVGNDLLRVTSDGADVRTYDLASLGVGRLFDFVPLGNDQILVRLGPYKKSLAQNIAMLLRLTNSSPLPREGTGTGLQVCDLGAMSCVPFSQNFDIDDVHWLARDPASGDVYVADTSRHRLYKFDANGTMIARKTTGFFFPNQIELVGNALRVVDTNHHVVKLVDTQTASFGKLLRDETHVPDSAEKLDMRSWPVMEADVGTEHWLLVMNNNMENGGIYRYTGDWTPLGSVASPNTEVEYVAPVGMGAWISDGEGRRVLEFDAQGNESGELQSPEFSRRMTDLDNQESRWTELEYAMGGLFVLSLLGGGLFGLRQSARGPSVAGTTQDQPIIVNINDRAIHWLEPIRKWRWFISFAAALTGVVWIGVGFYLFSRIFGAAPGSPAFEQRTVFVLWSPLMVVGMAAGYSMRRRYQIGILGDVLVLRRGRQYRAARGKSILYSDAYVAIDDLVAPLGFYYYYPGYDVLTSALSGGRGRRFVSGYRKEDVVKYLNPVIQNATPMGLVELQRYKLHYMTKTQWILLIAELLWVAVTVVYLTKAGLAGGF